MREAGDRTTWTEPDATFESAVHAAVDAAFDDPAVTAILDELLADVAGPGWSNAVSAKAIALTMPGVPDVYQGSELWEQSLVDPDNRRPVDFGVRRELLARVLAGERPVLTPHVDDPGHAKLLVTQAALTLRRNQPHRFTTYAPVAGSRPGRGSRRRLRPRRRDHGRDPAAGRTGRARLGRHDAVAARRRLGGPADRTRVRRCRAAPRPARRLPGRAAHPGGVVSMVSTSSTDGACAVRRVGVRRVAGCGSCAATASAGRSSRWPRPTTAGGSPAEPLPPAADEACTDYGYLLDDDWHDYPDPRSRRQPTACTALSRTYDPSTFAWTDQTLDRPTARRGR